MRRARRVLLGRIVLVTLVTVAIAGVLWWQRVLLLRLIPTPPVVITEKNNGGSVFLLQGQYLEVRLRGNRLSGFRWRNTIPVPFLTETGAVTFTEDESPASAGDGVQSTTFEATAAGRGPLFLSYEPDNDQNSLTPTKSFRVVVVVR